jgi:hypothetical protein
LLLLPYDPTGSLSLHFSVFSLLQDNKKVFQTDSVVEFLASWSVVLSKRKMEKKVILVTGGSGLVGKGICSLPHILFVI